MTLFSFFILIDAITLIEYFYFLIFSTSSHNVPSSLCHWLDFSIFQISLYFALETGFSRVWFTCSLSKKANTSLQLYSIVSSLMYMIDGLSRAYFHYLLKCLDYFCQIEDLLLSSIFSQSFALTSAYIISVLSIVFTSVMYHNTFVKCRKYIRFLIYFHISSFHH